MNLARRRGPSVFVSVMRGTSAALLCGLALFGAVSEASAQQHTVRANRARLSHDLVARLRSGDTSDTSVIVTGSQARVDRLAARHGLRVSKRLESGAVLDVPAGKLAAVANDADVDQLSSNQQMRSQMAVTNQTIGADLVQAGAWTETGGGERITGNGIGVAVIDSGIADLPELRAHVLFSRDFTDGRGKALDEYGHGTHVAGIIAAAGKNRVDASNGVAPRAHLINLKVLDAEGAGTAADVIEAIDFAIKIRKRFNIRVINLSLGGAVLQPWRDNPLCQAVERAYRAGIIVVAAAGNLGKLPDGTKVGGGIVTPGISPYAITVGALNTKGTADRGDDEVASYSSRGPTRFDGLIKPDFVAPGNKIASLAAPRSTLVREHPELVTGRGANARLTLSGTSMAAGVASGAVAALLEHRVGASHFAVKTALQVGARRVEGGLLTAGGGSLDLPNALELRGESEGYAFHHQLVWRDAIADGLVIRVTDDTIVWGAGKTIVWGADDTIVWGADDTIVWGADDTIVWGADDTIVWGADDTIVWGADDTIVWGADDTIVWGADDTIVWGADDTIVWGADDTIVWGADDTIVWGAGFTIVWGSGLVEGD
jgi:serine protease AprX